MRYQCGSGSLGERLTTSGDLLYVSWKVKSPARGVADLHGLAPRSLLRSVRDMGRDAVLNTAAPRTGAKPVVVLCVRRNVEMRRLSVRLFEGVGGVAWACLPLTISPCRMPTRTSWSAQCATRQLAQRL